MRLGLLHVLVVLRWDYVTGAIVDFHIGQVVFDVEAFHERGEALGRILQLQEGGGDGLVQMLASLREAESAVFVAERAL